MEKELQSKMKLLVSPTVARAVFKTEIPPAKSETTGEFTVALSTKQLYYRGAIYYNATHVYMYVSCYP